MKPITLTISAARSGTRLLSKLFEQVPDMHADHEVINGKDAPTFCSERQANVIDPTVGRAFVKYLVEDYVENLDAKYYACTAQSTSKGYIEHFIDLGYKPNFIIIRRDPRLIARSLWELGWIPGTHPMHRTWYPGPQEPGVLPYKDWKNSHQYQLCYWYVADCERRAQHYENTLPQKGIKLWNTTIEQMLDVNHFNAMLESFNLPTVSNLPQKKVNTLKSWKEHEGRPHIPDDFLKQLELDVLERIPTDFKANLLELGWTKP